MKRRSFLISAAALAVASPASALTGAPYSPGLVKKELSLGSTVFVDFYTDWCVTCRTQERIINSLKKRNSKLEEHIKFIAVDWDQHARSDLAKSLNIPRRSTLVALRGDTEIGRIVASTREPEIKALLNKALKAATS